MDVEEKIYLGFLGLRVVFSVGEWLSKDLSYIAIRLTSCCSRIAGCRGGRNSDWRRLSRSYEQERS